MRALGLAVVMMLNVGCGSASDDRAGSGGTNGGAGGAGAHAGSQSGGSAGGLADAAAQDADGGGLGAYPAGPYGNQPGAVLADMELSGYLRHDTTGLAYSASFGSVRLSDVRATAPVAHAVIHISGFT